MKADAAEKAHSHHHPSVDLPYIRRAADVPCKSRPLLDRWISCWDDLVRFEVIEVMTSAEAAAVVEQRM